MGTTILLVDDHRVLRETLRDTLSIQEDFEVVGEAGDGRTAVNLCRELDPDIAVVDIQLPEMNGVEATRQIAAESPDTRVIALTMHVSRKHIADMFEAGVSGYVIKESAFEELASAIRTVASGKTYLSPEIAGTAMDDYIRRLTGGDGKRLSPLGPREREVLQLLAEGKSIKETARRMDLSRKTVENHRRSIMEKLGIDNLAGLVKYAIREGLASLDD